MGAIRKYILGVMKDERTGWADRIVAGILRVVSWIYGLAVRVVDWSYRSGIRKVCHVSVPVISIGNITLGGTGKTPFAILVSEYLLRRSMRPAVLIRGYGNDENRMLKDESPDIPVLSGQSRVASAELAIEKGCDVLVLDDGFQHRKIKRDLNIVMVDSVFGFGNEAIFPRGLLREDISSLLRADTFVLTKTDMAGEEKVNEISGMIKKIAPGKPVVLARHKAVSLSDVTNAAYSTASMRDKRVCLLSGIGDPSYFEFLVKKEGAVVVGRIDNEDHHHYNRLDIRKTYKMCVDERAEMVIVTRKDHVKLRELDISEIEDKLFVLNIETDIVKGKEDLIAGLNSVISDQGA
ncbi:MAG: tetraacyldisaccharide 4'-kinase [Candidatus Tantalella remota]|nr:tetraacyldisaccharide 4'-kinase [Candidatus Tantalella remota]